MKRNLTKCVATGNEILKHHRRYDLQVTEICELIDKCQLQEHGDRAYRLLTLAFAAGVSIGRSIEQADKRRKVSYIYESTNT